MFKLYLKMWVLLVKYEPKVFAEFLRLLFVVGPVAATEAYFKMYVSSIQYGIELVSESEEMEELLEQHSEAFAKTVKSAVEGDLRGALKGLLATYTGFMEYLNMSTELSPKGYEHQIQQLRDARTRPNLRVVA